MNNNIEDENYKESTKKNDENDKYGSEFIDRSVDFTGDNLSPANNENYSNEKNQGITARGAVDETENFSKDKFNHKDSKKRDPIDKSGEEQHVDKSEKDKESKLLKSTFGTIFLALLLAIISVVSYSPLKNTFFSDRNNTKSYLESNDFAYVLGDQVRYLTSPEWYDDRLEAVQSIKYVIKRQGDVEPSTNMPAISTEAIEEQKSNSLFYLRLTMEEPGKPVIETSPGINFNKNNFFNTLDLRNKINKQYYDLDVTFIIPKDLEAYNDYFTHSVRQYSLEPNFILILTIGAISIFILMIIGFTIPYSYQRKANICNLYNKMFLELKGVLWIIFAILFIGTMQEIGNRFSYFGNFDLTNIIYNANGYFYAIGIPVTFILFLLIYLTVVYIKYIYYTGFKKGFLKNSFFGSICFYIVRSLRGLFKAATSIDINKDEDKKLLIILGFNLIALWIIAATSFLGVFLAIGYTVFLFKYLHTALIKVKALNKASRELSEGNFDITLDENIGVLSPISKNLNNIKSGFKLAIDEEVKGQRLKTELITNVSHDLKTPLTSIITYVDLLKNQDTTEENRKEYLDILDRKSKRLNALIEDLFEASKASSGNMELQLENLDVVALFRQTLGELEEKINKSTLQIRTNAPDYKVICELDGRRTYRVFENIMTNILKYSMPSSRVYITIEESEKDVSFTFKNISAYEMNFDASEITERFARGDKSRNTEGSGLGLAIAKSLVELQKGKLTIDIDGDLFKLSVRLPKTEAI